MNTQNNFKQNVSGLQVVSSLFKAQERPAYHRDSAHDSCHDGFLWRTVCQ